MQGIYSLFRIIIAKYLARDPLCPELQEVAASLFEWGRGLHVNVLPKFYFQ